MTKPQINPVNNKTQDTLEERIAKGKAKARERLFDCRLQTCSHCGHTWAGKNASQCPNLDKHEVNRDWVIPGFSNELDQEIEVTAYDIVDKPKHYMLIPDKDVEVIDVIESAVKLNGIPAIRAPQYANVLKYLLRCGRKGKYLEDLKKAKFYLDRMIENQELHNWNAEG